MVSSTQFLPVPPPTLESPTYKADLDEVKEIGKSNSLTRTADQTTTARIWASIAAAGAPGTATHYSQIWQNIARDISQERGMSLVETARLFVLMNVSIHDALQTTLTSKFIYGLWRPVTAVREADTDGNDATQADPTWLPLLTTPPYPSAPGNMACIAGSTSRVLERLFGQDNIPFSVTWTGAGTSPSATRNFSGFRELADQQAYSRIWGGIHFEAETLSSLGACSLLGDYAVDNVLRRR